VLNSEHPASNAIKPWDKRLDDTEFVESDADDQLILRIPFTGSVKLRSLLIRSGPGEQTPSKVCLYPNDDHLDFDDTASKKPTQEFEVIQSNEIGEYTVKPAKFSNVRSITLFFPSSQGADETRLNYLGFVGEWTELNRQPVITVFEANANLADHEKIQGTDGNFSMPQH